MADSIAGDLVIQPEVVADIAGHVALESYGVVGMAAPTLTDGIAKLLPARALRRGIKVVTTDDGVHIDLFVIVEHGTNIAEVSRMLSENVAYQLRDSTGIDVAGVDVHVQGVKVRS